MDNDKCQCKCKNKKNIVCEKHYIWNPVTNSWKSGKYVGGIIDYSVIKRDEIMETTKTVATKTVATKSSSANSYILLIFLLIAIALLIAVSIYYYLIKYRSKEKHLLSY